LEAYSVTPEEEMRRAGKAQEVLTNEMFKQAFSEIEEALLFGIRNSAFKDAELREKLCQKYVLLHDLRKQLQSHIETGQLAEAGLKGLLQKIGL
jgi:hypothetical protein